VVLREDLHLPPGKAAAKLIQAAIVSYAHSPIQHRYLADGEGTQVVLTVPDEVALRRLHLEAQRHELPCALVSEGDVVMTLGIGPVMRELAQPITEGLSLM
jgi:peptidyl-tRNA hydrolase